MSVLQRLKNMRLGEAGKQTTRQKALTKLCFFIATGRNAMVVVICAVMSYIFNTHGQTPFVLTGAKLYQFISLPRVKYSLRRIQA
jgi:hypothetical protein